VGTFTEAPYDEAKTKNWPVTSMKDEGSASSRSSNAAFAALRLSDVRFWHNSDLPYVRYSVAVGCKADIEQAASKMLDL
jgi:hypothetical protein